MKERPILFSAPMVRAILDGSKTQTRRAFGDRTKFTLDCAARIGEVSFFLEQNDLGKNDLGYVLDFCPYGKVGDRLWVRETTKADYDTSDTVVLAKYAADGEYVTYDHDDRYKDCIDHWWYSKDVCPSIHMPRDKSRISLEITGVRVERLNDISDADARAEGFDLPPADGQSFKFNARHNFRFTWNQIYKNWDQNPWVWVVEFKRV